MTHSPYLFILIYLVINKYGPVFEPVADANTTMYLKQKLMAIETLFILIYRLSLRLVRFFYRRNYSYFRTSISIFTRTICHMSKCCCFFICLKKHLLVCVCDPVQWLQVHKERIFMYGITVNVSWIRLILFLYIKNYTNYPQIVRSCWNWEHSAKNERTNIHTYTCKNMYFVCRNIRFEHIRVFAMKFSLTLGVYLMSLYMSTITALGIYICIM